MAIWPVFLDRTMHEDSRVPFGVGDTVSWDVILVDGEAGGWPRERLIDTLVRIGERPDFATRGLLASTPELDACWKGTDAVGSEIQIRAGLSVDLFNPPFRSTVTGLVTRIETVSSSMAQDSRGVWNPVGPWQLTDAKRTPGGLASRGAEPASVQDLGFLVGLELRSHIVQPFPRR